MSVGFSQALTGLSAGSNYVMRVPISYDHSRRSQPRVYARDVTNGAYITWLDGPKLVGAHDGADNLATLINSEGKFTQSLIGGKIYNITDGSSGTITAVSVGGTIITGALSGGTEDDWDAADAYMLVPPHEDDWVWCEPFCFELPTIARNGAAADCVACEWGVVNLADGDLIVHQYETQANLIDNPSLATGAGNPWIPDGWINQGLHVGDTQASSAGGAVIHSGSDCIEWAIAATQYERIQAGAIVPAIGDFLCFGGWLYGDGGVSLELTSHFGSTARVELQDGSTPSSMEGAVAAAWDHVAGVYRSVSGADIHAEVEANVGASGVRYADDVYIMALTAVSITCVPASQANSAESTGLRVDGRDSCAQPIPVRRLRAKRGRIRYKGTLRHDAADLLKFAEGATAYLGEWIGDANNTIELYATAANNLRLRVTSAGVATTGDWNCTGALVAAITYGWEIRYTSSQAILLVGGVEVAAVTPAAGIALATALATAYWGSDSDGANQADLVFDVP